MLDFLIAPAFAQGAPVKGGGMDTLIFMVLLFVMLYFLLIRPQQKQVKQHKEMLNNLNRGDRILTSGGLVAKIHRIDDANDELVVEIGEVDIDGKNRKPVRVRLVRGNVAKVLDKSMPGTSNDDKEEEAKEAKS
ncbi:protein translocase subunit yajC [Magnetococcus marinus MC-1]|uniref:Sec translocon accessory complex subunit YajC n=1 Tax=Magnetococcus marinus (strain ATCC BAA-1437 / JCM 17883 / MC-1) TaxID=156889 RepID=A0LCL0_MAGMM|nr:preprotein translocase subunit YajC [Magnetococcus marinus]ABK45703.1 protein translocase subunit yajC [Magnetococcus marinus MC-1]